MANEPTQASAGVGLPAGTKVGKYEVKERLGMGGQAIIYKCYDSILDRYVAIKQISPHLAEDPKFLKRFRREAQILARLGAEQPAIVTLHDVVEDERGLFIVMEYVEGHSLETILASNDEPIEPKAVLQILFRLAAALYDVHAAGIIHRDIKPGNIIIQEGLRPKITDFGVAASITGQTSMVMGTTKYMAPELFEGGAVDGRADMYSLGFIAYEMLLGRKVFNDLFDTIVRDKHGEAMRWMKWHGSPEDVAPPLDEVNPNVPGPLAHIVSKMIAKDPADRYPSMEALGRAIKTAFSPKAKKGGQRARRRGGQPRKPVPDALQEDFEMAGEGAAIGAGGPSGSHAGATAPVVPEGAAPADDGPATAPLPKKSSLSLRTKILLGVVIFSTALIFLIATVMRSHSAAEEKRKAAREAYVASMASYESGLKRPRAAGMENLDNARKGFEAVQKKYPGTDEAKKSTVMEQICKARLAMRRSEWGRVQEIQRAAETAVAQVMRASDKLAEWGRERRREIEGFSALALGSEVFQREMARAREALDKKDFDKARQIIEGIVEKDNTGTIALTDAQRAEKDEFVLQIRKARLQTQVEDLIAQAKSQRSLDRLTEAEKTLAEAQRLLAGDERGEQLLDKDWRTQQIKAVSDHLAEVQIDRAYQKAMKDVNDARASGNKTAEKQALMAAQKIRDTAEVRDRLAKLSLAIDLEEALGLAGSGRSDAAITALQDYLKKDPGNAEATRKLKELLDSRKYDALMAAGTAAANAADWAKALALFNQAQQVKDTPEAKKQITQATFNILLAKANKLEQDGEYDKAIAVLEQAAQADPSKAEEMKSRQNLIVRRQKYEEAMAKGDASLRAGNYSDARSHYTVAKQVYPAMASEVDKQIKTSKYRENIKKGDEALNTDAAAALGYYRIAASNAQTQGEIDEAKARIEKVKESGE